MNVAAPTHSSSTSTAPTEPPAKACFCCGAKYSLDSWRLLPSLGIQHIPADDVEPEENLETRNCACGSTLMLNVAALANVEELAGRSAAIAEAQ